MNRYAIADVKERATEIIKLKLDEVCSLLNAEYDDLLFYVEDNAIFVDCSDYSPVNIKILQI